MTVVASKFRRKENDYYDTPSWCVETLLRHIGDVRGKYIWEPAAGNHSIAEVLEDHGARVFTSDIKKYDHEHDVLEDFLGEDDATIFNQQDHCKSYDWIITNPPYGPSNRTAVKFAERALQLVPNVALLLTAKFDFGKTRTHLFRDNERFWGKIALLDRPQWFPDGEYASGTEDYAWYIWSQKTVFIPPIPPRIIYDGK